MSAKVKKDSESVFCYRGALAIELLQGFPAVWQLVNGWSDFNGQMAYLQTGELVYQVHLPFDARFVPEPQQIGNNLYEVIVERSRCDPFAFFVSLAVQTMPVVMSSQPSTARFASSSAMRPGDTQSWFTPKPSRS